MLSCVLFCVQAVGEGTAKRNIARKSRDQERVRALGPSLRSLSATDVVIVLVWCCVQDKAQGGGHKGMWRSTDDGTLDESVDGALDRDDPNYDSSVRPWAKRVEQLT